MQNDPVVGQSSSRSLSKRYGNRLRACESCHVLKIRCDLGSSDLSPPCRRCKRLGKECNFATPRAQKTADARVAELEAQVAALTAQLHKQSLVIASEMKADSESIRATAPLSKRANSEEIKVEDDTDITQRILKEQEKLCIVDYSEVYANIDRLIDSALAERIFHQFLDRYVPLFPIVTFPSNTAAEEIRNNKPILYLAILSCSSSGLVPPKLQAALTKESTATIAKFVVIEGQKTIELVQALLISALWFRAPDHHSKVNLGQLIRMAVTMAEDLGLDGRQRLHTTDDERLNLHPKCETQSLESRRLWCGCFILSASTSLIMRRADSIHWTEYLDQCLTSLETQSDALASDRLLCQYVRAERICSEAGEQLHLRDHADKTSVADPVMVYAMKSLDQELQSWSRQTPATIDQTSLRFWVSTAGLYIHEPALHVNHNIHEFEAPFTQASLSTTFIGTGGTLSSFHILSIHRLVESAHQTLESFISFPFSTLLILPPLLYASRVAYALILLLKLHICVTSPGSEISKCLQVEDLKFQDFLRRVHAVGARAAKFDQGATQSRVLLCTVKYKEWFDEHSRIVNIQDYSHIFEVEKDDDLSPNSFETCRPTTCTQEQQSNPTTEIGAENGLSSFGYPETWMSSEPFETFDHNNVQLDLNDIDMAHYDTAFDDILFNDSFTPGDDLFQF